MEDGQPPCPALGADSLLCIPFAATRPTLRMVCPPPLTSVSLAPSHANQGLSKPLKGNPEGQHHTQTQTEACVSYCIHRRSCQRQDKEWARMQSWWPHSASSVTFGTLPLPYSPTVSACGSCGPSPIQHCSEGRWALGRVSVDVQTVELRVTIVKNRGPEISLEPPTGEFCGGYTSRNGSSLCLAEGRSDKTTALGIAPRRVAILSWLSQDFPGLATESPMQSRIVSRPSSKPNSFLYMSCNLTSRRLGSMVCRTEVTITTIVTVTIIIIQ